MVVTSVRLAVAGFLLACSQRSAAFGAEGNAPLPCPKATAWPWCDPELPVERRVQTLLAKIRDEELAPMLNNDLLKKAAGVPRLGIKPYSYITEAGHGLIKNSVKPTPSVLPQAIVLAATFNSTLWKAVGEVSAQTVRYYSETGYTQNWDNGHGLQEGLLIHNNINTIVDPRWGRAQESPGECPFLAARFEQNWVAGVHTPKGPRKVPLAAASCKHFAAYAFEGGPTTLDLTTGLRSSVPGFSNVSRHSLHATATAQDLEDTYLPPFRGCADAGAKAMMCADNAVNGRAACADEVLGKGKLRDDWGFEGVMVTDCDSVSDIYKPLGLAASREQAVEKALAADTNIFCSEAILIKTVKPSMYPDMRSSVRRILKMRFELGEFDPPLPSYSGVPWPAWGDALAREAAVQGSVLLKNTLLPLSSGAKLALLGAHRFSNAELNGDYSANPVKVLSPLEGLRKYADVHVPPGGPDICSHNMSADDDVRSLAHRGLDAVVIVAGLFGQDLIIGDPDSLPAKSPRCQDGCLESEGCDRQDIALPGGQLQQIKAAANSGIPVILVLFSGGPLDIEELVDLPGIASILWMGYPGQQGGIALGSMLFGESEPSGRLTQTFYRSSYVKRVETTDTRMRPSGEYPGRTYRFVDPKWATFPFGFGLSYQPWRLENGESPAVNGSVCRISALALLPSPAPARGAALTLLAFLRPPPATPGWAPRRVLRGFERIQLSPGSAEATADFTFARADFELVDSRGKKAVWAGRWVAEIDGGSPGLKFSEEIVVKEDGSCSAKSSQVELLQDQTGVCTQMGTSCWTNAQCCTGRCSIATRRCRPIR